MKKLIVLLLTVATVFSLSVCSFAQTERVVKDADETWKAYLAELKEILTDVAIEKAKEDSDEEKLDELRQAYVDLLVEKVEFIGIIEKTSAKKAQEYKDEWNKAYKTLSEVTKYETAEWRKYLVEFRAAAEKYVEELEKNEEDYTNRLIAAENFSNLLMQRRDYLEQVFELHGQYAHEFLDEWTDIFLIVANK